MAYNLELLIRILDEEILKPHQETWILDNRNELDSLCDRARSLMRVLDKTSHIQSKETEALESQIRDAAHEAMDIIEPNVLDKMLHPGPTTLRKVIDKFDTVIGKFTKIEDDYDPLNVADSTISFDPTTTKHGIVVGLDRDVLRLKDRLTSQATKLEIIPIVGMGGIGKTTLAQNLYNDPLIRSHFHARAWVTVSQGYSVRSILLHLLGCILGKLSDEMLLREKNDKLALLLHKSLYGQRYLIIVDDIWSSKAWDEIKALFPKENRRSRILLTTRESHVAKHADPSCEEHRMHLLDDLQSWELLRDTVFGNESCPPLLERIGKKITNECRGLPLAISVIGGVLSMEKASRDLWERIARDVSSFVAEKDERFPNILTLSYNHLPYYLKPCLLYIAAFPEDYEVCASKLTSLWIAEGFVNSSGSKAEEAAEEYLKALVDRNLLSVRQYKSNGKAKSYSIHDLLRELCVKKAREDKFLFIKNWKVGDTQEDSYHSIRRVSVHPSYQIRDVYDSQKDMSRTRSFLYTGGLAHHDALSPMFLQLRLLRVLDVLNLLFDRFPEQVLQLLNLRFLTVSALSFLPAEISRLRKLQTLIVKLNSRIPSQLWEMLELRHLEMKNIVIEFEHGGYLMTRVQEKLQTLSKIDLVDLIQTGMLTKIPNIKKLGVRVSHSCDEDVVDLSHLNNLETLMFSRTVVLGTNFGCLPRIEFPQSIKKLTLYAFTMRQTFVNTVCSLPNLQVLKIRICDFDDEAEWEPSEGGFQSLRFLLLEDVNLMCWKADDTHYPKLRHVVIQKCAVLEGIPNSFGDIETLEKIELIDSSNPSLLASARQIEDEQREYGNESLQISIRR